MGLDIIVALVVGFGIFTGFSRGLVKTVFDTLSLFIGILAALRLSDYAISAIDSMFNVHPTFSYLIGLVVTFILVMAIIRFVGRRIEDVLEAANINIVNKLAGGVLQGLFFAFLLSMVVWTLGNYNVLKPETKEKSVTYPYLEPLPEAGRKVFNSVKPIFKDFWERTLAVMDSLGGDSNAESLK